MKKIFVVAAFVSLAIGTHQLFAQTGNGSVGGIVQDPGKALIPGVSVTLTNTATGVVNTQVTNESGAYSFAAVPPGPYKVTAELAGFKQAIADVEVGTNAQIRRDFTLEVGGIDQKIEVTAAPDTILSETSASVGTVLSERKVSDLPLIGQNVLDLLNVLPGFRASTVSDSSSTVGGLNLDYINTTVNGLNTNSSRDSASLWGRQVMTTNVINPDLVGEIRLIMAPVDAELGRGNGQIQIQTRSGTNKYAGAAVWNIQNTAFNANTWANKRNPGPPTTLDWYNLHQGTISFGGPIQKNKTFFYALYDQQNVWRRTTINTLTLTDTARQGIWRYWEGWNPGPALLAPPLSFATGTATPTGSFAAVDIDGRPLAPTVNSNGSAPYTGSLRCFSIFGNTKTDGSPFTQADCPGGVAVIRSSPWDQFRPGVDPTGLMRKILTLMPRPNYYLQAGTGATAVVPDGLNTGIYRWLSGREGSSSTNSIIGVVQGAADYNNRKQINLKIDHNFNMKHRVAVSWTNEHDGGAQGIAAWDGVLNGQSRRRPRFITAQATSTFSPALVNEARFGVNRSGEWGTSPWDNIDHPEITKKATEFITYGGTNQKNGRKYPILFNPGTNWNGYMALTAFDFANYSPLWNYADTIRWNHGKHAISAGGEYRRPTTTGFNSSAYVSALIGNAGGTATTQFFSNTNITNGSADLPNFLATTRGNAGTLLNTFFGAIANPTTTYWIDGQKNIKDGTWEDVTTAKNLLPGADPYGHQTRTQIGNEYSFFVKDDYKFTSRLTLNLGLRYDYALSPYLDFGLTNRLDGNGLGLFGAGRPSGDDPFAGWLTPGNLYLTGYGSKAANPLQCIQGVQQAPGLPISNCDPKLASTVVFVGPGTDHPDQSLVPESGRFGPAIGFAWQVPWFGDGKTTMRGGFQRTYGQAGSVFSGGLVSGIGASGSTAGANTSDPAIAAILATRALNLTDLPGLVPAIPSRPPTQRLLPVGARTGGAGTMYDPNYRTQYTDNITLSIQRSLNRYMTLELRGIHTAGQNLVSTGFDLNTVNVYHNPELLKAFEVTRAGGDDPLFDQMLMGLNLNVGQPGPYGNVGTVAGGVLQRGSAHIRRAFAANLANGNYAAVVTSLLTAGSTGSGGLQDLPIDPLTGATLVTSQRVLRNGCDRIANGLTSGFTLATGTVISPRCFPENYFITNPQLSTANYAKNIGYTKYDSFEAQLSMRPKYGISFLATYGFSKTMNQPNTTFTDPLHPEWDYGRSIQSVGQDFRTNGTIELPIGPGKFLLPKSSKLVSRLVERWQTGFIFQVSSGSPRSFLSGNNMLYNNGRPNIVGPWNNPEGNIVWNGQNGTYFGEGTYATYQDPQCTTRVGSTDSNGFNLQNNCTLLGLAKVVPQGTAGAIPVSQGRYGIPLLENSVPGQQGNLGALTMHTFPRWAFDANVSKAFAVSESKSLQFRIDCLNVLNHPTPVDPTGVANAGTSFSDTFGQITSKTGTRTFQAKVRFNF